MRTLVALALVFPLAAGCASSRGRWKVSPGQEARFAESREACRILTDEPEGFEKCMKRRGWHRESFLGGLFRIAL